MVLARRRLVRAWNVAMTSDRSNSMTLGALGMLSGAVAWALVNLAHGFGLTLSLTGRGVNWFVLLYPSAVIPGLVFGLIIGSLLRRRCRAVGWRLVGYVVAAALAFFGAIHASVYFEVGFFGTLPYGSPDANELAMTGFVGGLVWSLLLGLASIPLLRAPARVVLGLPVVIASAFGVLPGIVLYHLDHYGRGAWDWISFVLFAFGPGAYASSLAPVLRPAA